MNRSATFQGRRWNLHKLGDDIIVLKLDHGAAGTLANWRKDRGLTMRECAKRLNIGSTLLCYWEQGKRPIPDRIMKILEGKEISVN